MKIIGQYLNKGDIIVAAVVFALIWIWVALLFAAERAENTNISTSQTTVEFEDLSDKMLLRVGDTICIVPKGDKSLANLDTCLDTETKTLVLE